MSDQITTAFVQEYKDGITMLAQQKMSRLRPFVRNETISGKRAAFDQVNATTMQEKTSRHGDSPQIDTPHARRWVSTKFFETGDMVDQPDAIRTLNNPTNAYVRSFAAAAGRTIDDEIIAAFLATATTGENAGSTAAHPGGDYQIASGSQGMTLAKLLQAKEVLDAAENDPSEPYIIVMSARQMRDLLSDTTITSADYNTVRALVSGDINQFVGFTFVRSERLGTASSERQCIAWARNSMLAAFGQNPTGRITERADKSFSTYAYYSVDVGATRMDETGVVEILCTES